MENPLKEKAMNTLVIFVFEANLASLILIHLPLLHSIMEQKKSMKLSLMNHKLVQLQKFMKKKMTVKADC
jgi:hypothetical protein